MAGHGCREFPLRAAELPVYQERFYGWLRIQLTSDKVLFFLSTDGKAWTQRAEFPRGAKYAGAPRLLLLGRGTGGTGDVFRNDERWPTGTTTCLMGDLIVGRSLP